jgi:thioredoxin-related protein
MKPLAVIFESSGCLACQEYHHYFEERTEFRDLLHRFDIAQIDIHTSTPVTTPKGINTTSADWARSLGVQYTPSIIFFDDRAQQVFATEAYLRPFHLHASLKYVESRSYTQQPQFQRYVQQLADQMREQGLEPDLWK